MKLVNQYVACGKIHIHVVMLYRGSVADNN